MPSLRPGDLMLSTAQIRRQVTNGIMPMGTARRYLANLGWKAPEIVYLVAEIARDRELEEEKELAAARAYPAEARRGDRQADAHPRTGTRPGRSTLDLPVEPQPAQTLVHSWGDIRG